MKRRACGDYSAVVYFRAARHARGGGHRPARRDPVGLAGSDTAALAAAGDVNGDGVQDVAVGLQDDIRTREPASLSEITVIAFAPGLPTRRGAASAGSSSTSQRAGGDRQQRPVRRRHGRPRRGRDGDGLGEVAFGAIGAGPNGRANAGSVYIVLGRRQPGTVDVRTDPRVVRIDGAAAEDTLGSGFASAGDFDGDGRPDLVLAQPRERAVIGRGGAPARSTIDLARPPAGSTIELRGLDPGRPSTIEGGQPAPRPPPSSRPATSTATGAASCSSVRPWTSPGRGRVFVVRAAGGPVVELALSSRGSSCRAASGFGGSLATRGTPTDSMGIAAH